MRAGSPAMLTRWINVIAHQLFVLGLKSLAGCSLLYFACQTNRRQTLASRPIIVTDIPASGSRSTPRSASMECTCCALTKWCEQLTSGSLAEKQTHKLMHNGTKEKQRISSKPRCEQHCYATSCIDDAHSEICAADPSDRVIVRRCSGQFQESVADHDFEHFTTFLVDFTLLYLIDAAAR